MSITRAYRAVAVVKYVSYVEIIRLHRNIRNLGMYINLKRCLEEYKNKLISYMENAH